MFVYLATISFPNIDLDKLSFPPWCCNSYTRHLTYKHKSIDLMFETESQQRYRILIVMGKNINLWPANFLLESKYKQPQISET